MARKQACPCCGRHTLESLGNYEICPICGWEDDPAQSADPLLDGCANELCLKVARRLWRQKKNEQEKSTEGK